MLRLTEDVALPLLTVAVSTHGVRAAQVALHPPESGVDFLVLVQGSQAEVDFIKKAYAARDDVDVHYLPGRGVAASRNAAIDKARGDILLFADDDIEPAPEVYSSVREVFARAPRLDILRGLVLDELGQSRKPVPRRPRALGLFNSAGTGTVELAVRLARLRAAGVRFDENFGAGTTQFLGDEYIFIADALRTGLKGAYYPIPFAIHPDASSGDAWHGSAAAKARAAALNRVFGTAAPLIRLVFVLRRWRRFGSRSDIWVFLRG